MNTKWFEVAPTIRLSLGLILIVSLIYYVWGDQFLYYWINLRWEWLFIASLVIASSTVLGAVNIYLLLRAIERIPFQKLVAAYWFSWAFGLIIPGQIGDLVALSAWLRRQGLEWHLGISRTILDKLISFAVVASYAIIGGVLLLEMGRESKINLLYLLIGCVALFCILFILKERLSGVLARFNKTAADTLRSVFTVLANSPKVVAVNIAISVIKFWLIGIAYWSVFHAIGVTNLDLISVVVLAAASSLVAYVPVSFNGLGTVEVTGVVLFSRLGISAEAVISAYLCLRLVVLCLAWTPVIMWVIFHKK